MVRLRGEAREDEGSSRWAMRLVRTGLQVQAEVLLQGVQTTLRAVQVAHRARIVYHMLDTCGWVGSVGVRSPVPWAEASTLQPPHLLAASQCGCFFSGRGGRGRERTRFCPDGRHVGGQARHRNPMSCGGPRHPMAVEDSKSEWPRLGRGRVSMWSSVHRLI